MDFVKKVIMNGIARSQRTFILWAEWGPRNREPPYRPMTRLFFQFCENLFRLRVVRVLLEKFPKDDFRFFSVTLNHI